MATSMAVRIPPLAIRVTLSLTPSLMRNRCTYGYGVLDRHGDVLLGYLRGRPGAPYLAVQVHMLRSGVIGSLWPPSPRRWGVETFTDSRAGDLWRRSSPGASCGPPRNIRCGTGKGRRSMSRGQPPSSWATSGVFLSPSRWPPSPGLAPWAYLNSTIGRAYGLLLDTKRPVAIWVTTFFWYGNSSAGYPPSPVQVEVPRPGAALGPGDPWCAATRTRRTCHLRRRGWQCACAPPSRGEIDGRAERAVIDVLRALPSLKWRRRIRPQRLRCCLRGSSGSGSPVSAIFQVANIHVVVQRTSPRAAEGLARSNMRDPVGQCDTQKNSIALARGADAFLVIGWKDLGVPFHALVHAIGAE